MIITAEQFYSYKGAKTPWVTKNFMWSELLTKQTEKPSLKVLKNLEIVAKKLQILRDSVFGGRSVTITSGWRSSAYNIKLGGAKQSYHVDGMALDFVVEGLVPKQVQKILDGIWNGGLEFAGTWTHIDTRPYIARFDEHNKVYVKGQYFS